MKASYFWPGHPLPAAACKVTSEHCPSTKDTDFFPAGCRTSAAGTPTLRNGESARGPPPSLVFPCCPVGLSPWGPCPHPPGYPVWVIRGFELCPFLSLSPSSLFGVFCVTSKPCEAVLPDRGAGQGLCCPLWLPSTQGRLADLFLEPGSLPCSLSFADICQRLQVSIVHP